MPKTVEAILFIILYAYVFWILFLACAALYAQWKILPTPVRVLAAPIALVALIVDVVWEYTGGSLMFGELPPPHCYTFTQRLSYYLTEDKTTKRYRVAYLICRYLLNPFQIGGHCGR